jgi:hypothetical protein
MRDLTGAPAFHYDIAKEKDMWSMIKKDDEANYLKCAAILGKNK